ncbi:MAG: phosphatidylglycerophosphatase A [Vibrio sp.]
MNDPRKSISLLNPWHLCATGFGSGLSPVIPGTMGTLASIPLFLLFAQLPLFVYLVIVIVASLIGVKICQVTADDMGVHDHGSIVWDEFAGFWITMAVVPIYGLSVWDWHWIVAGFVLFRFFDMVKPWPISWLDKYVHGGLGIMVDDLLAGVFSAIALIFLGQWMGW